MSGRTRRRLAMGMATVLVLAAAGYWAVGSVLLAPYPREVPHAPVGYVEVVMAGAQGRLVAWVHGDPSRQPCALLVHGQGGDRRGLLGRAPFFAERGLAVFVFDLQAHGESEGRNPTFGFLEQKDVTTAVTWLRGQGCPGGVVVNGFSLGAAATLLSAPTHRADALIVEASFATLADAARHRFDTLIGTTAAGVLTPLFTLQIPLRLGFSLDDVRPVAAAAQIREPTVVIGGDRDPRATPAETRDIHQALSGWKRLWLVRGARHQDFYRRDPRRWTAEVEALLDEAGIPYRSPNVRDDPDR